MNNTNDIFEDFAKKADRVMPIVIFGIPLTLLLLFILSLTAGTPDFKLIRKGVTKVIFTHCGEEFTISDPVLIKVFFDDLEDYSKIKYKSFIKFTKSKDSYICHFHNKKGKSKIKMCFNFDDSFDLIITGDYDKDSYNAKYSNIKIKEFVEYNIKPNFQCPEK